MLLTEPTHHIKAAVDLVIARRHSNHVSGSDNKLAPGGIDDSNENAKPTFQRPIPNQTHPSRTHLPFRALPPPNTPLNSLHSPQTPLASLPPPNLQNHKPNEIPQRPITTMRAQHIQVLNLQRPATRRQIEIDLAVVVESVHARFGPLLAAEVVRFQLDGGGEFGRGGGAGGGGWGGVGGVFAVCRS